MDGSFWIYKVRANVIALLDLLSWGGHNYFPTALLFDQTIINFILVYNFKSYPPLSLPSSSHSLFYVLVFFNW